MRLASFVATSMLVSSVALAAPVPIVMTHSGRLLDGNDQPVQQTAVAFGFTLWSNADASDGSFQVWPASGEATCAADVANGLYTVSLGDGTCGSALTSDAFPAGEARFLQVSIAGVRLMPRLRIGTAPTAGVAAHALDSETLGGLSRDGFFEKAADLATATVGAGTLADALDARAGKDEANTFSADNQFEGVVTIGQGGATTRIEGGDVAAVDVSATSIETTELTATNVAGSGAGLTNLGQATVADSGTTTLQQALDARLQTITAGSGLDVTAGAGSATIGLSNSAASLSLVSGGAMSSAGGNVGIGKSPDAKLDVAGEVHATKFVGDGSGLTSLSADAVGAQLPSTLARTDAANTFTQKQTFTGLYPSAVISPASGHAYLLVNRASATTGESGVQWQTAGASKFWAYLASGDDTKLRFYAGGEDRATITKDGDFDVQHAISADSFQAHGDALGIGYAPCLACDSSGSYSCTRQQAAAKCKSMGMRMCSLAEMNAHAEAGEQSCCWGWTSDPDYTTLSRTTGITAFYMGSSASGGYTGGCGGSEGGLRTQVMADTSKAAAYCCR